VNKVHGSAPVISRDNRLQVFEILIYVKEEVDPAYNAAQNFQSEGE
jgi:hypothetical protein